MLCLQCRIVLWCSVGRVGIMCKVRCLCCVVLSLQCRIVLWCSVGWLGILCEVRWSCSAVLAMSYCTGAQRAWAGWTWRECAVGVARCCRIYTHCRWWWCRGPALTLSPDSRSLSFPGGSILGLAASGQQGLGGFYK